MIISCPACATRYDVDDERFQPSGRSVRCAACGESWFVPAPDPVEDLMSARRLPDDEPVRPLREEPRRDARDREEGRDGRRHEEDERPVRGRDDYPRRSARDDRDGRDRDGRERDWRDDERDDRHDRREARRDDDRGARDRDARDRDDREDGRRADARARERDDRDARDEDEKPRKGFWGRRDAREEDEEESGQRGGFFGMFSREREEEEDEDDQLFARPRPMDERRDAGSPREDRDARGRGDDRDGRHDRDARDPRRDEDLRFVDEDDARREAVIVDADFVDVDDEEDDDGARGFGRRVRAERRRATALARLDDLDPVAERVFNDEFFAALRVQPKELEKALRKARRRAEAREKNRMTPMRALGWSAWIGMVAATGFVAYAYRDDIVAMWPNTAEAYAVIGIDAQPAGLKIAQVSHRLAMSTNGPTIEITGALKNEAANPLPAPLIQAEALGPRGELLSRWTFRIDEDVVAEGALASFTTRAPAPEGVAEVALSFAPQAARRPAREAADRDSD